MNDFSTLVAAFENCSAFAGKLFIAERGKVPQDWTGLPKSIGDLGKSVSETGSFSGILTSFDQIVNLAHLPKITDAVLLVVMDNPQALDGQSRRAYLVYHESTARIGRLARLFARFRKPQSNLTYDGLAVRTAVWNPQFEDRIESPTFSQIRSLDYLVRWIPARVEKKGYIPVKIEDPLKLLGQMG